MIDMHTHILPGVDDGASDMEEAISILKNGASEGVRTCVLTPHIKDDSDWERLERIKEVFDALDKRRRGDGIDVELMLGAEIFLTPGLSGRLKKNRDVIIKDRYVLVELPFYQLPIYTEDVLFQVIMDNLVPVIAHPERYLYLADRLEDVEKWAENGTMFQINTGSLNGQYGMRVSRLAKKLIKNSFVHFLGSDVHTLGPAYCSFPEALKIVAQTAGRDCIIHTL